MRLLIVAALLMIGGAAHGVPVVPSFSQGSMTSRTEIRWTIPLAIHGAPVVITSNQILGHYLLVQAQHPAASVMEYRQNGRT